MKHLHIDCIYFCLHALSLHDFKSRGNAKQAETTDDFNLQISKGKVDKFEFCSFETTLECN